VCLVCLVFVFSVCVCVCVFVCVCVCVCGEERELTPQNDKNNIQKNNENNLPREPSHQIHADILFSMLNSLR
jgi:hypothetical protein